MSEVCTSAVGALQLGDIIAVPFEGYGDILCEITEIEWSNGTRVVTATDGEYTYLSTLALDGSVQVYPTHMKGLVQR